MNNRTGMAQREEVIRRTVYVSDIDQQVCKTSTYVLFHFSNHLGVFFFCFNNFLIFSIICGLSTVVCWGVQVTEEQLASLFINYGQVICLVILMEGFVSIILSLFLNSSFS